MPHPCRLKSFLPYATAVLAVGVAAALRLLVRETFGVETPFLMFFGAVSVSSLRGGIGPGLLATALAGLTVHSFFLAPTLQFVEGDSAQAIRQVSFLIEASFISVVCGLRRRAINEAHRRVEELRATLNSIGDAVVTADATRRVTSLNPAAEAATGWTSAAATGRPASEVVHLNREVTRERIQCPVDGVIGTGGSTEFNGHAVLVGRDGKECPIDASAAPIRNRAGRLVGVVLTFHDVTDRRQAEVSRAEVLRRTTAILENISDAFYALDQDWQFTYLNARALAYFGRAADTLLGRVIWDAIPHDLEAAFEADFRQAAATGRTARFKTRMGASGPWVEVTAYPSREGLAVYLRDITDQHSSEGNQARLRAELVAERSILRAVLDQMPAGVVVADARTGRVVVANAMAALPWDGRGWSEVGLAGPDERAGPGPLVRLLDRAIGGAAVTGVELKREINGGPPAWVRVNAAPVLDRGGQVTSAVLVIDDVTTEKEAEAVLRRSHVDLVNRVEEQGAELSRTSESLEAEAVRRRAAERSREQLAARLTTISEDERRRLSHELHDETSQLLASLIVGLTTVRRQSSIDAAAAGALVVLQGQAEQIDRSVHRIAWELRPAALDAVGLEAAVRSRVEQWSEGAGVPAEFHSTLSQARLPPDVETQIYRLITEALANVQKHARANRVSVSIERQRDTTIAAVEDDGRGFDPENVDSRGNRQGLGLLGMRERAHLLGGTLHIESSPGRGTTVLARIPYSPPQEELI